MGGTGLQGPRRGGEKERRPAVDSGRGWAAGRGCAVRLSDDVSGRLCRCGYVGAGIGKGEERGGLIESIWLILGPRRAPAGDIP